MSSVSSLSVCKPPSARFFSSFLRQARHKAFTRWGLTTAFLCSMILCLPSIYLGALTSVDSKLHHLTVLMVDYDTGDLVGPVMRRILNEGGLDGLGAVVEIPEAQIEAEVEAAGVINRIYEEQHWVGVVALSNASRVIYGGISREEFDEKAMVKVIYVEARQETVLPTCESLQSL
jgi:hypothetical protein